MTLATSHSKAGPYLTNGVTTEFAYDFLAIQNADLHVYKTDIATEEVTALVLDADYTVTGAGEPSGGTVVITPALATGYKITILRQLTLTQDTDFSNEGGWFPDVLESLADRLVMMMQQIQEQATRGFYVPIGYSVADDVVAEVVSNAQASIVAKDAAQTAQAVAEAAQGSAESASIDAGLAQTGALAAQAAAENAQSAAEVALASFVSSCYRVKSEANDYLVCHSWDGTTEGGTDVYVAKHWKLQHNYTHYEGLTGLTTNAVNEVAVTNGSVTETWVVSPSYKVDDLIWPQLVAYSGVNGGDAQDCSLIDIQSGREWAVKYVAP